MPTQTTESPAARTRSLVIWIHPAKRKGRQPLMLYAYFDDSGTDEDNGYCVVAGFLSSFEQWEAFSEEWSALLADSDVERFHATEAANRKGAFEGKTPGEVNAIVDGLCDITSRHAICRVAAGLPWEVYKRELQGRVNRQYDHPYLLCFSLVCNALRFIKSRLIIPEPLHIVMHRQPKLGHRAADFWHTKIDPENRVATSFTFGDDMQYVPIQAADMVAWLARRMSVGMPVDSEPYAKLNRLPTATPWFYDETGTKLIQGTSPAILSDWARKLARDFPR